MLKLNRFKKIKILYSFIVVAAAAIALGFIEHFFILFFSVTLHEMAHVLVAKKFGLKTEKIIFTPLGEAAVIKDLNHAEFFHKLLIILVGPAVNIGLVVATSLFTGEFWTLFRTLNLSIAVFNLLPVYPLDGGRIVNMLLGECFGVLRGNHLSLQISRWVGWFIFALGLVQAVLFPYNISLVLVSLYISFANRKEFYSMTSDFYRSLVVRKNAPVKMKPIKIFVAEKDTKVLYVVERLCYHQFCYMHITDGARILYQLDEFQVVQYIANFGFFGTVEDVYEKFCKEDDFHVS